MSSAETPAPAQLAATPAALPLTLDRGWEALEGDELGTGSWRPSTPWVEEGPRGATRWYRLQLDLAACRGLPLAFTATAVRDVDEAFLDGRRIGGLGQGPPAYDPATLHPRLYSLPTDLVNTPGPHELRLRVYHGPRASPVLREPPRLELLAVTADQAWREQRLLALAGSGVAIAIVLALMSGLGSRSRREPAFLAFAGFALLLVLYPLSGHSAWTRWPLSRGANFRFAAWSAALMWLAYAEATRLLLQARRTWRMRAYAVAFCLYALAVALAPDLGWLVLPSLVAQLMLLAWLLELLPPTLAAAFAGRPGARGLLVAHLGFAAGFAAVHGYGLTGPTFNVVALVMLLLLAVGLQALASRHAEARVRAVLEERTRLARDIHDTLAQGLVGISMQLEALRDLVQGAAQVHVERARRLVAGSLEEARRSVYQLRCRELQDGGLASALRRQAARLGESGVAVEVAVHGRARELPPEVEENLLYVGREALANAARHARPKGVGLALDFGADSLGLVVQDDGVGFEARQAPPEGHFGLVGMRERVAALGGTLEIESAAGRGTRLSVSVPLGRAAEAGRPDARGNAG